VRAISILAVVALMFAPVPVSANQDHAPAKPATQVCTLEITGMTCAGCEAAVRMAARSVDGVTDVKVSHAKGNAEVTFDPSKTTPGAIAKVVTNKSGFKAEPVEPQKKK
jgi:copper chaperone CopZ